VIVPNPSHEKLLHELDAQNIADFLSLAANRVLEHAEDKLLHYSIISVSEGPATAATKEHLHAQVKSTIHTSPLVSEIGSRCGDAVHWCVLCKMAAGDMAASYAQNEHFVALFPDASLTFCNTLIVPREHHIILSWEEDTLRSLASILKDAMTAIHAMTKGDSYKLAVHTSPWNTKSVLPFHYFIEIRPQAKPTGIWEDTGEFIIPGFPEHWAEEARGIISKIQSK